MMTENKGSAGVTRAVPLIRKTQVWKAVRGFTDNTVKQSNRC